MTDDRELRAKTDMAARARGYAGLLWATTYKFFSDNCGTMAASLSFYTFFSLPALLSLLLTLAGRFMDPDVVQQAVVAQVGTLIGGAGAGQVGTIIAHARQNDQTASIATILSLVALAFGTTATFSQLQGALNRIWRVKPDPRRNQVRVFLMKRVFSFGIVLTMVFFLLVSLAVSTVLNAASERFTGGLGIASTLLGIATTLISFAVITGLFALMFRYLPDARMSWRDVRPGAIGTALLFVLGKTVIGYYLGRSDPGQAYGAAGSLAIVLIWVYYTSMVLLFGAEFTEQWAQRYGGGIRPERGAIAYEEAERRVQTG
jgi:membrane protein